MTNNLKKLKLVTQSCPTLRDPMDCSPPGSSVHGISQPHTSWGSHFGTQILLPLCHLGSPSVFDVYQVETEEIKLLSSTKITF